MMLHACVHEVSRLLMAGSDVTRRRSVDLPWQLSWEFLGMGSSGTSVVPPEYPPITVPLEGHQN